MRIGLISFAHVHADRYQAVLSAAPGIEAAGIYDDNEERGTEAADRHRTAYFSDLQDLLRSDLDGVIVCSENSAHREHCIAAFDAGVHVLCEKPVATSLSDGRAMLAAAKANDRILKIAFTTRFTAAAQPLQTLFERGDLGRITSLVGMNRGQNPGGWFVDRELAGGGSMMDHIVHQLDFARWAFGLEPRRVYAESDTLFSDNETEDAGLVLVEFDGGVCLTIDASWSRPPQFPTWGDNIVEVNGTEMSALVNTQAGRVTRYADGPRTAEYVAFEQNVSANMIADFCEAIRGHESIGAVGEDGYVALEVALAAYRSARSGSTVSLPLE